MKKKITHDIICTDCGKPAKYNYQNEWQKFEILPDGDYSDIVDSWDGLESYDLCEECSKNNNL